jgi:predicted AlkP superfamily phosphohydrolase/phosphomutase
MQGVPKIMSDKLVVLGLDGANWDLIQPWLNDGILPNLSRLRKQGSWGYLRSQLPPVTCPNWKCYSTGKTPGKLGVFWWEIIDARRGQISLPTSASFTSREIFDYLSDAGLKVGVVNMPTTFPPKALNGYMVAGGPDSNTEGFTYPPELGVELDQRFNYRVHPNKTSPRMIDKSRDYRAEVKEILDLIDMRFRTGLYLLDKVDFLHITIFYINVLQHFFYRDEPVKQGWELIDKRLGEFIETDVNLILMSDHGSGKVDIVFHINTWLEQNGYLRGIHKPVVRGTLRDMLDRVGIKKFLKSKIPASMRRKLAPPQRIKRAEMAQWVDWDKSSAIASGQGPIYLTLAREDARYETLRQEIIERLETLRIPGTGQRVVEKVYRTEEVYEFESEIPATAPDLVFEQAAGIHTEGGIGKPQVFETTSVWDAENVRDGIFLAFGPLFRGGQEIKNSSIIDLAPTILHALALPVPDDMDGQVLKDVILNSSEVRFQTVSAVTEESRVPSVESSEQEREEEIIRERLRQLGYID